MEALKKFKAAISCMTLAVLLSCEIEDEYSKPDLSQVLGRRIATLQTLPIKIFWAGQTDEIISVSTNEISAFGVTKNSVRHATFPEPHTYYNTWMIGDNIFLLDYMGRLSLVDVTTFTFKDALADSVFINDFASPFSDTHAAYWRLTGINHDQPSVFIYDLKSGKEIYVATGQPWMFSPDGKQLLFDNGSIYYTYDLTSKAIKSIDHFVNYGAILRWTAEGINSFAWLGEFIVVRNETRGLKIGEWKSVEGLTPDRISITGNSIIISKSMCGFPNIQGDCAGYSKLGRSIIDVRQDSEQTLIYSPDPQWIITAFSPDEKNFAYSANGQLFITESEN